MKSAEEAIIYIFREPSSESGFYIPRYSQSDAHIEVSRQDINVGVVQT